MGRQWRHWLQGRHFILRSDHGALKQLLSKKGEDFSNRQYRWFEKLQDFSFEFQHLPGTLNGAADALSRSPKYLVSALELEAEAKRQHDLGISEVKEAAQKSESYQSQIKATEAKSRPEWVVDPTSLLLKTRAGQTVVPPSHSLKTKIVLEAHEPPFCAHLGAQKTTEQVKRSWWWEGMNQFIERIVKSCDVCQRTGDKRKKQEALLTSIVASHP